MKTETDRETERAILDRLSTRYGVDTVAPNLTRVTIDGSTGVNNYLRVDRDPQGPQVLSWTRVPFAS